MLKQEKIPFTFKQKRIIDSVQKYTKYRYLEGYDNRPYFDTNPPIKIEPSVD